MSFRNRRPRIGSLLGLASLLLAAAALAGCGGSSGSAVNLPKVGAARVFALSGFAPAAPVAPGHPVTISFAIKLPSGKPLTSYRTGSGPHTGVHLIIVRDDLAYIIHQHPPVAPDGTLHQTVTFPAPGPYRVLVDAYPQLPGSQANFQLFHPVLVSGPYHPRPLPALRPVQSVNGYKVALHGLGTVHAIQPIFVKASVTDPQGRPAVMTPWFGALAHAIFFHQNSLDYFHTHVCGPGAANCTSVLGASRVSGQAAGPGRMTLGVLLPVPGAWRLFLQMKLSGQVITAPFTLDVKP